MKIPSLGIQSYSQLMIGVSNHLLSIVFRFHYHSQKVIGSLGHVIQQVERYALQIFEVSSFLRTVLLTGQTADGRSYQRCVLGNALLVGNLAMENPVMGAGV